MLDLLLKAVDRVISLLKIREKRIQFRFKEIYSPAFAELQAVHTDYLAMFTEVSRLLKEANTPANFDAAKANEASNLLTERRRGLQPVRAKLAQFQSVLTSSENIYKSLGTAETEFLWSLVRYLSAVNPLGSARTRSGSLLIESNFALREGAIDPLNLVHLPFMFDTENLEDQWLMVVKSFNRLRFEVGQHVS